MADENRNFTRRNVTAPAADWSGIEALSHRLRPRYKGGRIAGNVSEALRACYHFVLEAEERGLVEVSEWGIRLVEPPAAPSPARRSRRA